MTTPAVAELQQAVGLFTSTPPESESPPELTAIALRVIAERLERCQCWQREAASGPEPTPA
jgi:hypothetical protein